MKAYPEILIEGDRVSGSRGAEARPLNVQQSYKKLSETNGGGSGYLVSRASRSEGARRFL